MSDGNDLGNGIGGLGDEALCPGRGEALESGREVGLGGERGLHRDDDIGGQICDSGDYGLCHELAILSCLCGGFPF